MSLKIYDTLAPQGDYPAVNAADVLMPDGTRLSAHQRIVNVKTFDLAALGLPTLDADAGTAVVLETDTTEILAALENGIVQYRVNVTFRGLDFSGMTAVVNPGSYTSVIALGKLVLFTAIIVTEGQISATAVIHEGLPAVTTNDNGKGLVVNNGAWTVGAVAAESGGSGAVPEFDLAALGMGAVAQTGDPTLLETDTTDICAALDKGAVKFLIPMDAGDGTTVTTVSGIVTAVQIDTSYVCTYSVVLGEILMYVTIMVDVGYMTASITPHTVYLDAYMEEALGGDY